MLDEWLKPRVGRFTPEKVAVTLCRRGWKSFEKLCYDSYHQTINQFLNDTKYKFFFFFNPWWVLACFTILFHNLLSLHFSLQFLTFIFFKSSSTWSSHLSLGLPTGLDEHGFHSVSFLTVLVVSIRITCATQSNLCDFINLTIFFFLN